MDYFQGAKLLQIVSGKFFSSDDRHIYQGKGILYSNYSWINSIETCIAKLESVDGGVGDFPPYIISFTNQLEKDPNSPLIKMADHTFVREFQSVCTFGFKSLFITDKNFLEFLCRQKKKEIGDWYVPSELVPRFFDNHIYGTLGDNQKFIDFVNKLIGLPRKKYIIIKNCLDAFSNSLIILNYNFDLAYLLLVYCLETLAQNFDTYEIKWDDYDQKTKIALEKEFIKIHEENATNIKNILLKSAHLKLTQRFQNFIVLNTTDDFFINESNGISPSIRKSEYIRAIKNTYSLRSKYAHNLKAITLHLKIPSITPGDIFHWEHEPYLTYRGLLRVTHHVMYNYINNLEFLEKEQYDYKPEIPGKIPMYWSSKYWINNIDTFRPDIAYSRLEAYLEQLQQFFFTGEKISNLDELMDAIEKKIGQATEKDQIDMTVLYFLYNFLVDGETKREQYNSFMGKQEKITHKVCIENMLPYIFIDKTWDWSANDCFEIYERYVKNKFSNKSIHLPQLFEIALIVKISNCYLAEGNHELYERLANLAILEASGIQSIQNILLQSITKKERIQISDIFTKIKGENVENKS